MQMNLNGLLSGVARVVERCKPSTEECKQLLLPLPHQTGAAVHRSCSSSSCSSPEHATDASATRIHPYSRSPITATNLYFEFQDARSLSLFRIPSKSSDASKSSNPPPSFQLTPSK